MTADRFWHQPGIVAALRARGITVVAPDRAGRTPQWSAEVDHLLPLLPVGQFDLVGASNGCSVAVRLALRHPERLRRLVLAWPATAGDPDVDTRERAGLIAAGASPDQAADLLAGDTLRGVADAEVSGLSHPVGLVGSAPPNPPHQRHTLTALARLLPRATWLLDCPEPPRPDFGPFLEGFVDGVAGFLG